MAKKCKKVSLLFSVLFCISLVMIPKVTQAAILYLTPQSQTISKGDSFIIEVRLDTEGEEINTIEANLIFSSDLLGVVDFSKGGSLLNLWVEAPALRGEEVSFVGGVPGGFKGEGLIGKIIFLGKETGKTKVSPKQDSKVLLNDGMGTPANLSFLEGNYEIVERAEGLPGVISKSHPDQNKWYKETTLSLYWELGEETEYSWVLSYSLETEPDEIPDRPEPKGGMVWIGAMEYENLEDGTYYFHLRQATRDKQQELKWGPKVTFRAMIDTTVPESFTPEIGQDPVIFEGRYFLSFATQDKMSGIDHYEIAEVKRSGFIRKLIQKEEEKEWKSGKSPYLLGDQNLQSKILVKAVDKAGNEQIAEKIPPYKITWEDVVILVILLLILTGGIWWLIRRTRMRKHET